MSRFHQDEFERIKREHEEVKALLKSLVEKGRKAKQGRQSAISELPSFDPSRIEAAVATLEDAYALLLIVTAEGFMRAYILSLGISSVGNLTFNALIDQCRREFNRTNPRIQIRAMDASDVHDLRKQRNQYAHGTGSSAFPSMVRIVAVLGKFFDQLP